MTPEPQAGAGVTLTGVHQRYPRAAYPTLTDLHLDLPAGEVTALLGPSGCGKSTLLSIIAGLLPATRGTVLVDGTDSTGLPAEKRDIGVVFQRPLLFPHLTALDNVAFGPRRRGTPSARAKRLAAELLDLVGVAELADRRPTELSGGQAQRVALARALAPRPRILLLDEPLSALDPETRTQARELIRRVQREFAVTTLFVTHDQDEAVQIGDRLALLLDGRIAQAGTVGYLHRRPVSAAVAGFLGNPALLPGDNAGGRFAGEAGSVAVPPDAPTGAVYLVVPDHAVELDTDGEVKVTVEGSDDLGTTIRVRMRAGDGTALRTTIRPGRQPPDIGSTVTVRLHRDSLWTVPRTQAR